MVGRRVSFLTLVLALLSVSAIRPSSDGGARRSGPGAERQPEATFAYGALQWRLMTLRGPDGRIPPDGLLRAREHMQRMRLRRARAEAAQAAQPQVTGAQGLTASSQIARDGWRWLGPGNIGGRVRSLLVHPTNPDTMFTASVSGGIWRSDDAAGSWRPVDDFMGNLVVSSMVMDPRDPNIIYAGTGEIYHNYDALHGGGIFKSTDGGVTWAQLSATATDQAFFLGVGRLAMSADGRTLVAAAGGFFFRSVDGGATFTKSTQLIPMDVDFHPTDSNRAVAVSTSGSGYYTVDAGATWQRATGVPTTAPPGRLEVTYARSQPDVVYLTTLDGAIHVSTDGGISYTQRFAGFRFSQGWYNLALWVNPRDANHLILGAEQLFESTDGGFSWRGISNSSIHVDHHVIVEHPGFDNASNRTVFFGTDGGVYRTDVSAGQTYSWTPLNGNLGITQFYAAAGNAATGQIIGGTQDNGTLFYRAETGTLWNPVAGGDGGFAASDQTDPNVFYGSFQFLRIFRTSGGSFTATITGGIPDAGTENANFIAPFVLDPNDQRRLLAGGRSLWRTSDAKAPSPSWTNIKSGATESNISAIAVAPGYPDIIWVGHNGGSVYKTTNGTAANPTWTLMHSTVGSTFVTRITIDPTDPSVVYVGMGGFSKDALMVSVDGGATWARATGTGDTALPVVPVRDVDVDPFDPFTIYAATEVGLFVSHDRGTTWELPHDGPANVSVDEMFVMGSTLVAATHGRGLFALDLAAQGRPAVTITPDRIDFGAQPLRTETARQRVSVSNTGTAALVVQSVQRVSGDADFIVDNTASCVGVSLAPGAACGFDVRFWPNAEGAHAAVVQVASTAPGSPHQMLLTGVGATTPPPPTLPAPWASQDIGAVGVAGTAAFANGVFTLEGAGADIWGTTDAFHFAHRTLTGDGEITARVATIEPTAAWTKMGVMVRASLTPSSAYALMLVSTGKGLAFQRRTADAALATHTSGGAGTAPYWVRLQRAGNLVTGSISADGVTWTIVGQDTIALGATAYVGLAAHSHDPNQLATTTIDDVTVTTAPTSSLPSGWQNSDIGNVGVAGTASFANGVFTLEGAGADIWGTTDAFHFAHHTLSGDGEITARVATIENTAAWTKMGVMVRASLSPSSAYALMLVSSGKGLAFQRRAADGVLATHTSGGPGTAPHWVRLQRAGNLLTAFTSFDGNSWTMVGQDSIALGTAAYIGLTAHSHDPSQLATATFDNVSITTAPVLPAGWQSADIGNVGVSGRASFAGGTFTLEGAGADIWGTSDAFHFAYRTLSGDGEITARVATIENTAAWTKMGVMVRASLSPGSAYALMLVSSGKGLAFQRRTADGAFATHTTGGPGTAPHWVRIRRAGNLITAFTSADGVTWTTVGQDTIALGASVSIGLAAHSHDPSQAATATFDNVTFSGS